MLLHASCVAWDAAGVLICGRSGSGKSALALSLMAFGADLVADDRTAIELQDGWPVASAPPQLHGIIEARGIGVLAARTRVRVRVRVMIDLDQIENDRLPPERTMTLLNQPVALLHKVESPYFAAGVLQYLKGGKADR